MPQPSVFPNFYEQQRICVIQDRIGLKSGTSVKSVGNRKNSEKDLRHLRNLRDLKNNQREKKKDLRENKKASEIFRNLRLLIKEGGYLLSRIALQYHRRK